MTELPELAKRVESLATIVGAKLEEERDAVPEERDAHHELYLETLEKCRKVERGGLGQKAERLPPTKPNLRRASGGPRRPFDPWDAMTTTPETRR